MVPPGLDLHVMHYPGNLEVSGKWKFTAKVQVNGTQKSHAEGFCPTAESHTFFLPPGFVYMNCFRRRGERGGGGREGGEHYHFHKLLAFPSTALLGRSQGLTGHWRLWWGSTVCCGLISKEMV